MPLRVRPACLLFAGLCLLAGCDLLGQLEGFLSQPTRQEIDATEAILEGETGCAAVLARAASSSTSGSLSTSDCQLSDDSYVEFWLLKTTSAANVSLELTSDDFAPYLGLFPVDLQNETALGNEGVVDANADGDGRASLTSRISAGLYVVIANSVQANESGSYALQVDRGG